MVDRDVVAIIDADRIWVVFVVWWLVWQFSISILHNRSLAHGGSRWGNMGLGDVSE